MEKPENHIMVVDCQLAGISGDLMLGALLGVGADETKVKKAIESSANHVAWCREIKVSVSETKKGEFIAKSVNIEIKENSPPKGKGRSSSQLRTAILKSADELKLSTQAKNYASSAINTLIEAEMRVHGEFGQSETELHELGSADTVADIVGTAAALDDLKVLTNAKIYSTPVAVGGGLFKFSHGVLQSPGPVALEILRKFSYPLVGGPIEKELVTPTGASLLVNLVNVAGKFYPQLRPSTVGYGAGKMDLGVVPNILRIVLGNPVDYGLLTDSVYVLETNLDDVEGETIGFLMERLLRERARDVCVIPATMKKSRPGQILEVIVDESDVARISRIIVDETGSLGVRGYPVKRYIALREVVPIDILIGGKATRVGVKVGKTKSGEIINLKPEYEDVSRISIETGKPFKEIEELVREAFRNKNKPDRVEDS